MVTDAAKENYYEYCIPEQLDYNEGVQSQFDLKRAQELQPPATSSISLEESELQNQHVSLEALQTESFNSQNAASDACKETGRKRPYERSDSGSTYSVREVTPLSCVLSLG